MTLIFIPDQGLFNIDFIEQVNRTVNRISEINGTEEISNPLSQRKLIKTPFGIESFPLIHRNDPNQLKTDSLYILNSPYFKSLFDSDFSHLPIQIKHKHFLDGVESDVFFTKIDSIAKTSQYENLLVGRLAAETEFIGYIKSDFLIFTLVAIILSLVCLVVIIRDIKLSFYPFFICAISLIWVFGIMAILRLPINIMSSLLPPIILFISSADAIHLISVRKKSFDLTRAYQKVFRPTLLTSLTTGIGFLSLLWIDIRPIQILGITASLGALFAFLITYSLAPFFLERVRFKRNKWLMRSKWPVRWVDFLLKKAGAIQFTFIFLAFIVIGAVSQLKVDAFLLSDLPNSSKTRQAFDRADEELGGSKPWELALMVNKDYDFWDPSVLKEVEKIEKYLEETTVIKLTNPITPAFNYVNSILNGTYDIPAQLNERDKNLIEKKNKSVFKSFDEKAQYGRLSGIIPELGSLETVQMNRRITKDLSDLINGDLLSFRITGTNYLIDKSHDMLAKNLITGIISAIIIVAVLMAFYFRSFRMSLVALIPNIFPLLFIGAAIYILNVPLQFSTAIVFMVAFGIVVDDSIHFLASYKQNEDLPYRKRLIQTFTTSGLGIINTTFVLVVGFSIFFFSNFGATFYLGFFLCLSMLFALITDMTLLPLLLKYVKTKGLLYQLITKSKERNVKERGPNS